MYWGLEFRWCLCGLYYKCGMFFFHRNSLFIFAIHSATLWHCLLLMCCICNNWMWMNVLASKVSNIFPPSFLVVLPVFLFEAIHIPRNCNCRHRSAIHGRGLFCKRNIEAGEMVIEYSGIVIRSVLTDKREKYYDGKVSWKVAF